MQLASRAKTEHGQFWETSTNIVCSSEILAIKLHARFFHGSVISKGVRGIQPFSLELLETIVINFKH